MLLDVDVGCRAWWSWEGERYYGTDMAEFERLNEQLHRVAGQRKLPHVNGLLSKALGKRRAALVLHVATTLPVSSKYLVLRIIFSH